VRSGSPLRPTRLTLLLALVACDLSVAQEDELGDQYASSIVSQLPIIHDSAANVWLGRLGARLTTVADRESRDWHFYLVDDNTVNAFAVPGGHIFVHRGLIDNAATFAELAGVLGHEVAHVTLRHSVDQMRSRTRTGVIVTVVCAVVNFCNSGAAQVAIDVGGQALLAKYSRDDEAEADSAAVGYLLLAGIDPRGIPAMFERLGALRAADPIGLDAWFGSHPAEVDRVARTEAIISRIGPLHIGSSSDDSSFLAFQVALRGSGTRR
jgi:predicted Zn-dependent protease